MKIKMELPIYSSAMFEADIDVDGKDAEEIFDEFLGECSKVGYLCHHCSKDLFTDYEVATDVIEDEPKPYVDEVKEMVSEIFKRNWRWSDEMVLEASWQASWRRDS